MPDTRGMPFAVLLGVATWRHIQPAREVALIVNLRSRSGEVASQAALHELQRQSLRVVQSRWVRSGPELLEAVREAIAVGLGTIVIGGGDGTLSSVVDLFANRHDLTLGLLPMGTGNEVARILGIPLNLEGACRIVAEGRVETVDLGEANGNFFLHTGLVGFPARANHTTPGWLKARLGRAAYLYSLLLSILTAKPFRATVTAGSRHWEGETVLVVVGNSRFHLPGKLLLPAMETEKSGLVVYTPRDSGPATLLWLAVALWVARRPQPSALLSASADLVTVMADPPQEVDLDGEFARFTPVGFRLARRALRILVPDTLGG